MIGCELDISIGGQQQHRRPANLARQESQEEDGGNVGSLKIVDDDEERLAGGGVSQKSGGRVEEPETSRLRVDRCRWAQIGKHRIHFREHLGDVDGAGPHLVVESPHLRSADVGAQRLHPRPVGRSPARFPALAPKHGDALVPGSGSDLVGETSLTDARFATYQEQTALPGPGIVECGE